MNAVVQDEFDKVSSVIEILAEPRPVTFEPRPFKIRFATSRVRPSTLPEFAYIPHSITSEAIVFEAVVNAQNLQHAVAEIKKLWADARPEAAEEGNRSLQEMRHIVVNQLGAFRQQTSEGFWRRFSRKT